MHHNSECGCGHHSHQGHAGMAHHPHQGHGGMAHHGGGGGCCCGGGSRGRHFYTKEETITHLEDYLKQLQAEARGVEEHLNKLKTEK